MELDEETRTSLGGGSVWNEVEQYCFSQVLERRHRQVEAYREDAAWQRRRRRTNLASWKKQNATAAADRLAYMREWRKVNRDRVRDARKAAYERYKAWAAADPAAAGQKRHQEYVKAKAKRTVLRAAVAV